MMRAIFAMAALLLLACGAAGAQTVVVGPNGVTVYDRNGSGFAFGNGYSGPVYQSHGPGWRDDRWRDREWRDDRGVKRGHGHDRDDWKWRGYQSGYGYGDARFDGYRDCRRIERRDWVHGRRVIISEVVCFDRWGRGQLQPGTAVLRDCPDYYRGW
jgi:hypothetical protein